MSDKHLKALDLAGVHYLPPAQRGALEQSAARRGLRILVIDLSGYQEATGALRQIGADLQFPTWYGTNFDALFDCLTDPDWTAGRQSIILLVGTSRLRQANPEQFATLLEVLQAAADACREHGTPCRILLDIEGQGINPLPAA